LKGARTVNSRSARIVDDPAPTAELVAPLSGPSYGAYSVARRRWRKPLPAIIADALTNNCALNELYRRTREQIAALETFAQIEWRE
jgi:hypothetical protein